MSLTSNATLLKPEELNYYLSGNSSLERFTIDETRLIWQAYQFAFEAHKNQKRESGEPFITHPLESAKIVMELGMDAVTVAATLLHDVIEDAKIPEKTLEELFNHEVAQLVSGVTTLEKISYNDSDQRDADAIKNLFLAMISDPRVIIIKLADRLHNMRTIHALPIDRQRRKAKETLEIYAPIAERLGIWKIKSELEDTSFKVLEPKLFQQIAEALNKSSIEHEAALQSILQHIKNKMIEAGYEPDHFEISGRRKHIYSIYKKMNTPKYLGKGIDSIYDKIGIRIIVETDMDCYKVLGLIHEEWPPLPGEFDDFIGMRLPSGYRSLHTTVKYGPTNNEVIEFQIRTYQMHNDAEYGIAAHWRYKERGQFRSDPGVENKVNWLRQMLEEPQSDDSETFVAFLKADVLQERVYAFTPKGDVIDLPQGATPIDFAYHVHTEVGHRCRGAKVNGRLVPLDYHVKTGDVVEIITAKHGGPSRDWLNANLGLVNTQRARSKIRNWFKEQDREQNLAQGKIVLERELKRLGLEMEPDELASTFEYRNADDLYVAVGCGDLSLGRIITRLSDLSKEKQDSIQLTQPTPEKKAGETSVSVVGMKGMLTTVAKCCKPVQGDDILGYITRGRGVTIHRQDCPNILRMQDRERIIKVTWGTAAKTYRCGDDQSL
jgi:GTP pyrophosphokinase